MEKEDIISVQRAQKDVETSYNLLNNNGQYEVVAYMYFTSTISTVFFIKVYMVLFLFSNVLYVFLLL